MTEKDTTPEAMRQRREDLGLMGNELASALGYEDNGRQVRAWEYGERNGMPCTISGPARVALTQLEGLVEIESAIRAGHTKKAHKLALDLLPEKLREKAEA